MAVIPKLDDANLQAICDILGDTSTGLTGSEIGRYLRECGCPDPIPQMTRRHRLHAALLEKQNADRCANNILGFIIHVMNPVRHVGSRHYFEMIDGYEVALANPGKHPIKSAAPASVRRVLKRALKRRWHHLAEERIEDVRPQIPMGKRFWPVTQAEKKEIGRRFKLPEVCDLITSLKERDKGDEVEVVDAAYWMKGCSSLGRLRFAVLLGIGEKKKNSEGFCLIDIKEAVPAAAPHFAKAQMPRDHAKRVVEGARKLSPYLGQRMLPGHFAGTPAVLRELLPQDLKLQMDQLTREEAIGAARFLASVVGEAHAQQMDKDERREWHTCLKPTRSKKLDAPSWLWASVVQLVASHESAYLEHCRQYALDAAK